ncbi:MAG: hypothetical protein WC635_12075 [Bacteriovorax sp.]
MNIDIAHRLAVDSMNDYTAARLLIKEQFVLNSIQLACTAIEKLLKSFLYLQSDFKIKFDHDPSKLFKNNKVIFENYFDFNVNFLIWLGKVYRSRYTSDYGKRKEIQFGENHFLSELDFTFNQVFSFFKICNLAMSDVYFSEYRIEIRNYKNYLSQNKIKQEFIKEAQQFFAFQLFGVEHLDIIVSLKSYNPEKPFVFRDSVLRNGNSVLEIDVGCIN